MAPEVGLEPTTLRLTAACSTIELLWNSESAKSTGELGPRQTVLTGKLHLSLVGNAHSKMYSGWLAQFGG